MDKVTENIYILKINKKSPGIIFIDAFFVGSLFRL